MIGTVGILGCIPSAPLCTSPLGEDRVRARATFSPRVQVLQQKYEVSTNTTPNVETNPEGPKSTQNHTYDSQDRNEPGGSKYNGIRLQKPSWAWAWYLGAYTIRSKELWTLWRTLGPHPKAQNSPKPCMIWSLSPKTMYFISYIPYNTLYRIYYILHVFIFFYITCYVLYIK